MNQDELEELYIRSLDAPLSKEEKENLSAGLRRFPELAAGLSEHDQVRQVLSRRAPATFGPYFAARLMLKIENTGIAIDRQIFSFFKKFQLAVLGVIVGLLILNVLFTDQVTVTSIFGIDRTVTPATDEADVPFDFVETLNKNL